MLTVKRLAGECRKNGYSLETGLLWGWAGSIISYRRLDALTVTFITTKLINYPAIT